MLSKFLLSENVIDERAFYNNTMFVVGDCINVNGSTYIITKRTFNFKDNNISIVEYDVKDYYMDKLMDDVQDKKDLVIEKLIEESTSCPSCMGIRGLKDPKNCGIDCEDCRKQAVAKYLKGDKEKEFIQKYGPVAKFKQQLNQFGYITVKAWEHKYVMLLIDLLEDMGILTYVNYQNRLVKCEEGDKKNDNI